MNCAKGVTCQKCQTAIKSVCDMSGWAVIEYILFCLVLWWVFYYLLLIISRQTGEWCCRFLTLIHGCLISYAAIRDIYSKDSSMTFATHALSEAQKSYLSYMLSYFLFDFGWMHFFGNEKWIIYFHHLTSIIIIINVLIRSYGGDGVSYGVASLELSNPYLQLRWFLRTHGQLNKPIHTVTELWFVTLFFLLRMIGGTILLYRGLLSPDIDFGMKLSCLAIYGISVALQWQICGFIRKKYLTPEPGRGPIFLLHRDSLSPYFQRRSIRNNINTPLDDQGQQSETEEDTSIISSATESVADGAADLERVVDYIPEYTKEESSLKGPHSDAVENAEPKSPKLKTQIEIPEGEKTEIPHIRISEPESLESTSDPRKPLVLTIKR